MFWQYIYICVSLPHKGLKFHKQKQWFVTGWLVINESQQGLMLPSFTPCMSVFVVTVSEGKLRPKVYFLTPTSQVFISQQAFLSFPCEMLSVKNTPRAAAKRVAAIESLEWKPWESDDGLWGVRAAALCRLERPAGVSSTSGALRQVEPGLWDLLQSNSYRNRSPFYIKDIVAQTCDRY